MLIEKLEISPAAAPATIAPAVEQKRNCRRCRRHHFRDFQTDHQDNACRNGALTAPDRTGYDSASFSIA
jgi:hypothetical protein